MMESSPDEIESADAVVRSVVIEGGRGPSALSAGQRWSAGRKREVVLRLMRGEPVEPLSRELGLPIFNGHRSPDAMRAAWHDQTFRRAA
jgi:hypothetical protein